MASLWHVQDNTDEMWGQLRVDSDEGCVCILGEREPGWRPDAARVRMAHLIAAAPALLAALKDAYAALDYAQAQVDSDADRMHLTRCRRKIKPVIDAAEGRDDQCAPTVG